MNSTQGTRPSVEQKSEQKYLPKKLPTPPSAAIATLMEPITVNLTEAGLKKKIHALIEVKKYEEAGQKICTELDQEHEKLQEKIQLGQQKSATLKQEAADLKKESAVHKQNAMVLKLASETLKKEATDHYSAGLVHQQNAAKLAQESIAHKQNAERLKLEAQGHLEKSQNLKKQIADMQADKISKREAILSTKLKFFENALKEISHKWQITSQNAEVHRFITKKVTNNIQLIQNFMIEFKGIYTNQNFDLKARELENENSNTTKYIDLSKKIQFFEQSLSELPSLCNPLQFNVISLKIKLAIAAITEFILHPEPNPPILYTTKEKEAIVFINALKAKAMK